VRPRAARVVCRRRSLPRPRESMYTGGRREKGRRVLPYKRHEDFVAWNRAYQRKRSAGERKDRATVEGRIIDIVREQPSQHSTLSLYALLREEGFPLRMVERAIEDLLRGHILTRRWQDRTLVLQEGEDNPFARKLLAVEEERMA